MLCERTQTTDDGQNLFRMVGLVRGIYGMGRWGPAAGPGSRRAGPTVPEGPGPGAGGRRRRAGPGPGGGGPGHPMGPAYSVTVRMSDSDHRGLIGRAGRLHSLLPNLEAAHFISAAAAARFAQSTPRGPAAEQQGCLCSLIARPRPLQQSVLVLHSHRSAGPEQNGPQSWGEERPRPLQQSVPVLC